MKKVNVVGIEQDGNNLKCKLECGHVVDRKVKRRGGIEDPKPVWVYCPECKDD